MFFRIATWYHSPVSSIHITIKDRIRSAFRILLARRDNAVACSFCGRNAALGETIVAGPGVSICGACAYFTLHIIAQEGVDPVDPNMREIGVMPIIEPLCLLPSRRATLAIDLADAAKSVDCRIKSWSYNCTSAAGDQLAVYLECKAEMQDAYAVHERFKAVFLEVLARDTAST